MKREGEEVSLANKKTEKFEMKKLRENKKERTEMKIILSWLVF